GLADFRLVFKRSSPHTLDATAPLSDTASKSWRPVFMSFAHTLRHREFRNILFALTVSNTGYWMQTVAAAYLMRTWTAGDPLMVSLVQSALFVPTIFMLIPAGMMVDLVDRRRFMMFAQSWMMIAAGAITVLVLSGTTEPWFLLALLALFAVGFALSTPAQSSLWPELVGIKEVGTAISLYSLTNNGARLVGPAIAGALIPIVGAVASVAFNAVSYLAVIVAVGLWKRPPPPPRPKPKSLAVMFTGGFAFAAGSAPFRAVLIRCGLFFLVAAIVLGILPVKVAKADDFGTVFSFFGLGAMLGAFNYPRIARRFPRNTSMGVAVAVHACGLFGLGLTDWLPALCATTCVVGFSWFFVMSAAQVGSQMILPDEVRGRGLALLNLVLMSGYAFGSPLWGALARATSPDSALKIAAVVSISVLALTFRLKLPEDHH
ncbi:MAG: MFS transporter, partial [Rhodobacteraceae bacterium]|nr:MFS transporter [Paracoccaceae bacterium]